MHSKTIKQNYLPTQKVEPQCVQTYSCKFTNFKLYFDVNRNLHPALQRAFLGCQFLLFTLYTLLVIHLVYPPKLLGYYIRPKVYKGNVKMTNHSFFFILKNFVVWCTVFFYSIFRNNIADTDRAKCFMLSCWTPLLLGTENKGVILPLLWWSSIAVINNGSDTG